MGGWEGVGFPSARTKPPFVSAYATGVKAAAGPALFERVAPFELTKRAAQRAFHPPLPVPSPSPALPPTGPLPARSWACIEVKGQRSVFSPPGAWVRQGGWVPHIDSDAGGGDASSHSHRPSPQCPSPQATRLYLPTQGERGGVRSPASPAQKLSSPLPSAVLFSSARSAGPPTRLLRRGSRGRAR